MLSGGDNFEKVIQAPSLEHSLLAELLTRATKKTIHSDNEAAEAGYSSDGLTSRMASSLRPNHRSEDKCHHISGNGLKVASSSEAKLTKNDAASNDRPPNSKSLSSSEDACLREDFEEAATANESWMAVAETSESTLKKAETDAEAAAQIKTSGVGGEAVHHHHHHHHYHHHHHTLALSCDSNQLLQFSSASKAALEVISGLEKAKFNLYSDEASQTVVASSTPESPTASRASPAKSAVAAANLEQQPQKKRPPTLHAKLVRSNTTIEVAHGRTPSVGLNSSQPGSPQIRPLKASAKEAHSQEEAAPAGSDPSSPSAPGTPSQYQPLSASNLILNNNLSRSGSASKMSRSGRHSASTMLVKEQLEAITIEHVGASNGSKKRQSSKHEAELATPPAAQPASAASNGSTSNKKEKYKSLWGKVGQHGLMQAAAAAAAASSNDGSASAGPRRPAKKNGTGWDQVLNPILAKHRPQVASNAREANYSYHVQKVQMGEAVAGSGWTGANMECDCGEDSCPRCNLMINMAMDEPQPQW